MRGDKHGVCLAYRSVSSRRHCVAAGEHIMSSLLAPLFFCRMTSDRRHLDTKVQSKSVNSSRHGRVTSLSWSWECWFATSGDTVGTAACSVIK